MYTLFSKTVIDKPSATYDNVLTIKGNYEGMWVTTNAP